MLKGSGKDLEGKSTGEIKVTLSCQFAGTNKPVDFEVDEHPRDFNETLEISKKSGYLSFLQKDGKVIVIPLHSVLFLKYFSEVKKGKSPEKPNLTPEQEETGGA